MEKATKSRYRFVVLAILSTLGLSIGLTVMAMPPLFPILMEEYRVNRATIGLLQSVIPLMNSLFNIVGAIMVTRIGLRKAFLAIAIFMSVGILTLLATTFPLLLAIRTVFGAAAGLLLPVATGLVMQWFSDRELPLANGCHVLFASLGMAITSFITVPLSNAFGWRTPLSAYGMIPLLVALAWLVLGKKAGSKVGVSTPGAADATPAILFREVFKPRVTFLLGFAFTGAYSLWFMANAWLPTYYYEVFHIPLAQAGSIMGLLNFVGMTATIVGSVLPARIGLRKPFFIIPGFIIVLAGFGSFSVNNMVIITISVMALGACAWLYIPSILTLPMELPGLNPRLVGMIVGVAFGIGHGIGFLAPITVGYLADTTGSYLPGFIFWSIVSSSLLICGLLLPETGPGRRRR